MQVMGKEGVEVREDTCGEGRGRVQEGVLVVEGVDTGDGERGGYRWWITGGVTDSGGKRGVGTGV